MAWVVCVLVMSAVLLGLPLADLAEPWGTMDRYAADVAKGMRIIAPVSMGIGLLMLLNIALPVIEDGGRRTNAIFRAFLLVPVSLILPTLLWGACHTIAVIGRDVRSDPRVPLWFDWPVFWMIGSCWAWALIPTATVALTIWAAIATVRLLRSESDECEQCGYSRRGIASSQCPECGAEHLNRT